MTTVLSKEISFRRNGFPKQHNAKFQYLPPFIFFQFQSSLDHPLKPTAEKKTTGTKEKAWHCQMQALMTIYMFLTESKFLTMFFSGNCRNNEF